MKKSDICTDSMLEGATTAVAGDEIRKMEGNEKLKYSLMGKAAAAARENVDTTTTTTSNGGVDMTVLTETLEALDAGKETSASLQYQVESLNRSEMIMDSTQYVLDKARVVLRGMTYLGSIRNYFSEEPILRRSEDIPDGDILEGFLCSECKAMFEGPDSLQCHYATCHMDDDAYQNWNPYSCDMEDPTLQTQQEYIDALLPVVGEMNVLSRTMDASMRRQNDSLCRMNVKQDTLKDDTLLVTRKASRIAGLRKEKKRGGQNPAYRIVVLSQVGGGSSGKPSYMCVEGRNVQLVEEEVTASGSWQLHDLGNGFCGFRSCLSNKWLGQGPLGGVRCSAHRLGRWEEWQRVDDGGSSPSPTRSLFPIFCTCLKKNEKPASLT
eukprot:285554_1